MQTTFGASKSGFAVAGSSEKTSKAAAARCPDRSASATAASSTRPPRAQLTRRAPGFIRAIRSADRMLALFSVFGRCRLTKSARPSSSSMSSTRSTPIATARSADRKGS